jgi:hypothetical protein
MSCRPCLVPAWRPCRGILPVRPCPASLPQAGLSIALRLYPECHLAVAASLLCPGVFFWTPSVRQAFPDEAAGCLRNWPTGRRVATSVTLPGAFCRCQTRNRFRGDVIASGCPTARNCGFSYRPGLHGPMPWTHPASHHAVIETVGSQDHVAIEGRFYPRRIADLPRHRKHPAVRRRAGVCGPRATLARSGRTRRPARFDRARRAPFGTRRQRSRALPGDCHRLQRHLRLERRLDRLRRQRRRPHPRRRGDAPARRAGARQRHPSGHEFRAQALGLPTPRRERGLERDVHALRPARHGQRGSAGPFQRWPPSRRKGFRRRRATLRGRRRRGDVKGSRQC